MSFASLRRIVRSAKKGLCSSCGKAKYPQLEAASVGHVGCLMYTVDTGGLNVRDEFNASALHMAARKGQISILIYLIQNKIATEVYRAANGATPAHDAAGTGNLNCLRFLIIHSSCSPHDRDMNGSTPLHWAAQFGHLQVVAWLVLEANAQVDAITKTGVTPLHLAASKGYSTILRWLINHAYKKHANPMRLVNSRARNGATPLYFAAQEGHIEIVKWLAEKAGGDPTIFSTAGMAPLHAAAQEGHIECVQYLFRFGLATSGGGLRSRQDGASALHHAACQGHEGVVAWLLSQKQCTGSEKDFVGSTPVHDAADEGRVKILQIFYNHGVNLVVENSQGDTPLDLARHRGMKVCIQFLEMALKKKLPYSPSANKQITPSQEEDQLLISEVTDFYGTSPSGASSGAKWETFRDLMESEELLEEDIEDETPLHKANDVEEEKRKKLREQMRIEEDMKQKMRMEKMKNQKEREKQIRENLLAEEESIRKSLKESGYHSIPTQRENRRPLSMPSLLPSNVEKDTIEKPAEINDTKKANDKKAMNRYLRKSTTSDSHLLHANNSNSSLEDATNRELIAPKTVKTTSTEGTDSSRIPSPPSLPKMEYLLSKLPKSKQIQITNLIRAESILSQNSSDGNDSDTASVGSSHSRSSRGSSEKKRRREGTSLASEARQNKPSSSPPLPRRARVRQLTPYLKADGMKRPPAPSPKRLFYDEPLPFGQLNSPSPSPTVSPFSSGASSRNITPQSSFREEATHSFFHSKRTSDPGSPYDFMKALNTAIETTPNRPKIMRQTAVDEDGYDDGTISPTLQEIEHQIQAMQQMVGGEAHIKTTSSRKAARDDDNDNDDDDDYDDDEEDSSSSELETSSDDDMDEFVQVNVIKPHMQTGGVTIHAPKRKLLPIVINGRLGGGVINRGRLVQKRQVYRPRLYSRRRFSRLETIVEESEEIVHTGTPEERADALWSLRLQQKVLKGWLSYIEFMKVAHDNAENMYQKTRRELITKVFYTWVQVRNYGALDKINHEKAESHYRAITLTKAIAAWRYAMQLVETKPLETLKQLKSSSPPKTTLQPTSLRTSSSTSVIKPAERIKQPSSTVPIKALTKTTNTQSAPLLVAASKTISRSELKINKQKEYLAWLNKYLKPIGLQANDLGESVANGVYVLRALGEASGKKVPRYHEWPILPLQKMSNWKLVTDFMKELGINVRGIEPEDLTNNNKACLHNMFANILKWEAKRL